MTEQRNFGVIINFSLRYCDCSIYCKMWSCHHFTVQTPLKSMMEQNISSSIDKSEGSVIQLAKLPSGLAVIQDVVDVL